MEVILLKELQGKGGEGDVVDVAAGFANNYLFPQRIAIAATKGNLKQLEQRRNNINKREEVRLERAHALADQLEGAHVEVKAQIGEEGQLFGSVTAPMVAEAVNNALDLEIDRRRIELGRPIKTAGEHPVTIGIYRDIKATVTIDVVDMTTPEKEALAREEAEALEAEALAQAEAALADGADEAVAIVEEEGPDGDGAVAVADVEPNEA